MKKSFLVLLCVVLMLTATAGPVLAATNIGLHSYHARYRDATTIEVQAMFYNVGNTLETGISQLEFEVRGKDGQFIAATTFNDPDLASRRIAPGEYLLWTFGITGAEPGVDLSKWTTDHSFSSRAVQTYNLGSGIKVFANGDRVSFDVPPVIKGGRTLVPLRAVLEAVGIDVEWKAETSTIIATKGSSTATLRVGQQTAVVDGKTVSLDVPPEVVNGRTLIPLRFVSEALGGFVFWGAQDQIVSIVL